MEIYTIALPDVGEGVAEAELAEWNVSVGDVVAEDDVIGAVMTDKATVEIPTPVGGTVLWLCAEPGAIIPTGSKLIQLEVVSEGNDTVLGNGDIVEPSVGLEVEASANPVEQIPKVVVPTPMKSIPETDTSADTPKQSRKIQVGSFLAAPSVRAQAKELGVNLRMVSGSGPEGRINHADLEHFLENGNSASRIGGEQRLVGGADIKILGVRRKIGEAMRRSIDHAAHITMVEEIDVTDLESSRASLNAEFAASKIKLTMLPFLLRAIVIAVRHYPEVNALYDDENGVLHKSNPVHVGIATQTDAGLMVPVCAHAEARSLWDTAAEIWRLSDAARIGSISRDELTGSTITISSLGPLGGLISTPILNHPEVAIIGTNKISIRPVWDGKDFLPRKIMNLSCSFDHRIIDGWNGAQFLKKLKHLLENPALLLAGG